MDNDWAYKLGKDTMNTTDKIINEMAIQLANKSIEHANYKVFYQESQEKLVEAEAQLARVNNVLEADEALKELFDEVAEKLEKED